MTNGMEQDDEDNNIERKEQQALPEQQHEEKQEDGEEEKQNDDSMDIDTTTDNREESIPAGLPALPDSAPLVSSRRLNLRSVLGRPSMFGNETGSLPMGEYDIATAKETLAQCKVLVVGAGGLGCEVLKNLAMSGMTQVHVIDLDTIDVTNLNRQFLFRETDVGKSKSVVAADFINRRCPWMTVVPHVGKIQDKEPSFYAQFQCIISGLDNIEARRWLNATICGLVQLDDDGDPDPTTIIPLLDGGTEGFAGQARVILPRITSCFECSLDAFPPQTSFPLCTIADTPRRPEHCIAYAYILQWPKEFGSDKKIDTDSPTDMQWIYQQAVKRAEQYNISGVTYMLTLGVVKNIIPAVASTNAIVAAACVNEAIKAITFASQSLNNYMMYMGSQSVYSHTFVYEPKPDCIVCKDTILKMTIPTTSVTLNEFIQRYLCNRTDDTSNDEDGGDSTATAQTAPASVASSLRLKSPSITTSNTTLYMEKPPSLQAATRPNLDKVLSTLIQSGEYIYVSDPVLHTTSVTIQIFFDQ